MPYVVLDGVISDRKIDELAGVEVPQSERPSSSKTLVGGMMAGELFDWERR